MYSFAIFLKDIILALSGGERKLNACRKYQYFDLGTGITIFEKYIFSLLLKTIYPDWSRDNSFWFSFFFLQANLSSDFVQTKSFNVMFQLF